jgi:hypothetical protein
VFVLDATNKNFVDHLARAHQEAAAGATPSRERSDIARAPTDAVQR